MTGEGPGGPVPPPPFEPSDAAHIRSELARLEALWEGGDPVSTLLADVRGIVLGAHAAGDVTAQAAAGALRQRRAFSLVRIGDGEGNVLGCRDPGCHPERELRWFDMIFRQQAGITIGQDAALDFASRVERAAIAADVLGIRGLMPWAAPRNGYATIGGYVRNGLADMRLRPALGHLRAQDQVERWARAGALRHSLLTHAWVHLPLLDHLAELVTLAERVILVTGRSEILDPFARRHAGGAPVEFLGIPPEAGPHSGSSGHYPEAFEAVCRRLEGDLRGCLVLVGAGIFGKIYCDVARNSGGVALDLGSGFDILAGRRSRPVHNRFDDILARHRLV